MLLAEKLEPVMSISSSMYRENPRQPRGMCNQSNRQQIQQHNCRNCGQTWNQDQKAECQAIGQTYRRCSKPNHFANILRSNLTWN